MAQQLICLINLSRTKPFAKHACQECSFVVNIPSLLPPPCGVERRRTATVNRAEATTELTTSHLVLHQQLPLLAGQDLLQLHQLVAPVKGLDMVVVYCPIHAVGPLTGYTGLPRLRTAYAGLDSITPATAGSPLLAGNAHCGRFTSNCFGHKSRAPAQPTVPGPDQGLHPGETAAAAGLVDGCRPG